MLEGLSRALGYRRAVVALYDPARGALRGTVGLNVPDALVESIEIPLGEAESPMVIALREGVPLRVDDTRTQSRLARGRARAAPGDGDLELRGRPVAQQLRAIRPGHLAGP